MEPQILSMPFPEYLGYPAVSRSLLWNSWPLKRRPPKTWAHAMRSEPKRTGPTDFGSALHAAVLEPYSFDDIVLCGPYHRRGNKWSVPKELADKNGQILLTRADYEKCCAIQASLLAEKEIGDLLTGEGNLREKTIIWTDEETGIECKIRPDLIVPDQKIIIDLKTAANASKEGFQSSIAEYGYHVQEAMYREGHAVLSGSEFDFFFLAVEPEPPFEFSIFQLSDSYSCAGYNIFRSQMLEYKQCAARNHWPGYPREVVEIDLPPWMRDESSYEV